MSALWQIYAKARRYSADPQARRRELGLVASSPSKSSSQKIGAKASQHTPQLATGFFRYGYIFWSNEMRGFLH
jgi:hypothetical protein